MCMGSFTGNAPRLKVLVMFGCLNHHIDLNSLSSYVCLTLMAVSAKIHVGDETFLDATFMTSPEDLRTPQDVAVPGPGESRRVLAIVCRTTQPSCTGVVQRMPSSQVAGPTRCVISYVCFPRIARCFIHRGVRLHGEARRCGHGPGESSWPVCRPRCILEGKASALQSLGD